MESNYSFSIAQTVTGKLQQEGFFHIYLMTDHFNYKCCKSFLESISIR